MKRLILAGAAVAALLAGPAAAQDKLLNASYDVARELFAQENAVFTPKYKADTGKDVTVDGWYPKEEALEEIERARNRWRDRDTK